MNDQLMKIKDNIIHLSQQEYYRENGPEEMIVMKSDEEVLMHLYKISNDIDFILRTYKLNKNK